MSLKIFMSHYGRASMKTGRDKLTQIKKRREKSTELIMQDYQPI